MKLKVLMFGWEFPPFNSGGLGTACYGLTRALSIQDADITFVLPKKIDASSNYIKFRFADDNVPDLKIKQINSNLSPYLDSNSYQAGLSGDHPSTIYGQTLLEEVLRYSQEAAKIAQSANFDVIHAHDWLTFPAGIAAKKVSGKPLVVHIHSTEFDRTGGGALNDQVYKIEKEGMEQADQIITVSEWTKNQIIKAYGIEPTKIKVVHNGIETSDYQSTEQYLPALTELKKNGHKIVLFVGRVTVQKGPDYFLKAAKRVLEYDPKVYFLIVGSGDMENMIIEQSAKLGISDKVLFAGFLRGQELNQVYRQADLFIMPSVSEPFGITALEAAVNGTPVIISNQSGVKEVLRHVLSVDFWDTEELANQILAVLRYDSLQLTLKHNGSNQVKEVSWNEAATKCLAVYQSVLNSYFGNSKNLT